MKRNTPSHPPTYASENITAYASNRESSICKTRGNLAIKCLFPAIVLLAISIIALLLAPKAKPLQSEKSSSGRAIGTVTATTPHAAKSHCGDSVKSLKVEMAYGQSLAGRLPSIYEDTQWSISHEGKELEKGVGLDISQYVFDMPGRYVISARTTLENLPCLCAGHDEEVLVDLTIHPTRFEWKWDEDFWHELLSKQKEFSNTPVSIPVTLHSHGGEEKALSASLGLYLAGAGCNLTGACDLASQPPFQSGETRNLTFTLTGTVATGIYTQMDFMDPFGTTKSFSILKPLN